MKVEQKIESLLKDTNRNESIKQRLNKFKSLFKDNEIMSAFDKDVFELMIEKVIIGEKEENGKINPRVITFILKSGNEIKCQEDKTQQSTYEVSKKYARHYVSHVECCCLLKIIQKKI